MKKILSIIFLVLLMGQGPVKGIERQPVVAGYFYPSDQAELSRTIQTYLAAAAQKTVPGMMHGLVVPHAGYQYSAVVAAAGYRLVDASKNKVILIGSSHRMRYNGASIPDVTGYKTPLGTVPLHEDTDAVRKALSARSLPQAHENEHSLEVQLPFLQMVLKNFKIIPILLGNVNPKIIAEKLLPLIDQRTLIIASTDLSHYYPYSTAQKLDHICTTAIPDLDFTRLEDCRACGRDAVEILMHIAKNKSWHGMVLDYRNSGDTAGTKDRVVGYAGIAFYEAKEVSQKMSDLTNEDRNALLALARTTISAHLNQSPSYKRPENLSPAVDRKRGCFVTLHKHGALRGCIGTILPRRTLYEGVAENAVNAAFSDYRFSPLTVAELSEIDIEISVLTVPKSLEFKDSRDLLNQLRPHVDGVILSKGYGSATFLPQVWDQLPKKEEFLMHLCQKARLGAKCWEDPKIKVEVYQAEYFSEKEFE